MNENTLFPLPPGVLLPSGSNRHYRSTSGSPTRHHSIDELLTSLTPASAIEAFRNPSGALKSCIDTAAQSEQSFAMAAALASKKIQDWLAELSSWQWPSGSSSAGFDPSAARGRRLSGQGDAGASGEFGPDKGSMAGDMVWLGCLRADEVTRYERRIGEIQQELDEIDMERIKKHVLHNHILPLSRPGTPLSDSNRSSTSTALFYNKMDDMTALITATVVQSLPNLSRLTRLMQTWSIRLLILRRVPSTLTCLDDAEVALRSGWNAVDVGRRRSIAAAAANSALAGAVPALSRKDFDIMKLVLEQKVSHATRAVDFMLDTLDGRQETVPDDWIDRMDRLERDYAEWVTVCERMIREAEWAKAVMSTEPAQTSHRISAKISSPAMDPAPVSSDLGESLERPGSVESDVTTILRGASTDQMETPPHSRIRSRDATALASEPSPPSSPPLVAHEPRPRSVSFSGMPAVAEDEAPADETPPKTPLDSSFIGGSESEVRRGHHGSPSSRSGGNEDDQLQQQISEILESIPHKIHLSSQPSPVNHLNPPDLHLPHLKPKPSTSFDRGQPPRNHSSMSSSSRVGSRAGSRAGTPSFLLAPARSRAQRSNQDTKVYNLSPSNGDAPIKLLIRLVGENGERVMVRVGGGWADLGEYLNQYAIHHVRRSKAGGENAVEIKDVPSMPSKMGSSPASRPASALDSPITPLNVRKTRRSFGPADAIRQHQSAASQLPKTPMAHPASGLGGGADATATGDSNVTPPSETSTRSRSSSRLSWTEEDSSLGMSGPRTKNVEMSEESRAWVASVKERVRIASGERRQLPGGTASPELFGEIGKVGGTKRLFKKS